MKYVLLLTLFLVSNAFCNTLVPITVTESDGVVQIQLILDEQPSGWFARHDYTITDGTAIDGVDYSVGNQNKRLFYIFRSTTPSNEIEIEIINNDVCDGDKTIIIEFDTGESFIFTITDDDYCGISFPQPIKIYEETTIQINKEN